jgi:hypothetical protein
MSADRSSRDTGTTDVIFSYGRRLTHFFVIGWPIILATWVSVIEGFALFWHYVAIFVDPLRFGWTWIAVLLLGLWHFLAHRPVRVNDNGISAYLFGRAWRTIRWRELRTIKTLLTIQPEHGGKVQIITFISDTQRITIRSHIQNYERLRFLVNEQLERLDVPVAEVGGFLLRMATVHRPGKI